MKSVTLSVVIPTRGRPEMLGEALASVREQTLQPDEVIVSDNHGTPRVDETYVASVFPYARVVSPPESLPVDEHWLWALRKATSSWVCLLEDDNWWRPTHLRAVANAIAQFESSSIIFTGAIETLARKAAVQRVPHAVAIPVDLVSEAPLFLAPSDALAALALGSCAASSAVAVRRTVLDSENIRTLGLTASHDRWLWAQVTSFGGCAIAPELTMVYRLHSDQMIKHLAPARFREEGRRVVVQILDLLARNEKPLASFLRLRDLFPPADWKNRGGRLARQLTYEQWSPIADAWGATGRIGWLALRCVPFRAQISARLQRALA